METSDLVVGTVYSMDLYPERLYGSELKDVTFKARLDSDMVAIYGIVVEEEHKKVYSTLPTSTPNSPSQYQWLAFKTLNGNLVIIGEPWVRSGSVIGGDVEDIWDITGIMGDSDTPLIIRNALSQVGIYEYTLAKRS